MKEKYKKNYKKQISKKFFNTWAKTYDSFIFKKGLEHLQEQIIKEIKTKKGRLLDIGCGTGYLLSKLSRSDFELHGLDFSKEMLKIAKTKLNKKILLKLGDAEKLPFKNNYFDYVVSAEVLHHLPHPTKAFKEIYRVLKKRGKVILVDISFPPTKITNFFGRWFEPGFIKQYSKKELKKIFKKTGFIITKQKRIWFFAILTKAIVNKK